MYSIWKTIVHIIRLIHLWNEPYIRSCRDVTEEFEEPLALVYQLINELFFGFTMMYSAALDDALIETR